MERLSKKSIFSYALGDLASQLVWTFVGMYLSVYYLDVVGLAPAAASAIMLIAKVWDAVNDPMMGAICERTHSKYGRFRPYILYGTPFLAIFSVLTFTAPFGNGTAGVLWAAFAYIGAGMLYTLVNIPYGAMAAVMTTHNDDRTKLNAARGIGMQIGILIVSFGAALLLTKFSGSSETITGKSYTMVAILFAIISIPMFLIVFKNSKEVITPNVSKEKVSLKASLKVIASNKYLMIVVLVSVIIMVAYMFAISRMKDIKRVFMYHGAEHKSICCFEKGLPLTVENVRGCRRFHPRCGTSFIFVVIIISILVSSVVVLLFPVLNETANRLWWMVCKIFVVLPIVTAISYEFIRYAGRHDNVLTKILSAPGLWMQRITTAEPEDDMIEVAIASIEGVLAIRDEPEAEGAQAEESPRPSAAGETE